MKFITKIFFVLILNFNAFASETSTFDSITGKWTFNYVDGDTKKSMSIVYDPIGFFNVVSLSNLKINGDKFIYNYGVFNSKESDRIIIGTDLYGFRNLYQEVLLPNFSSETSESANEKYKPQTMFDRAKFLEKTIRNQFSLPEKWIANLGSIHMSSEFLMSAPAGRTKIKINGIMLGPDFSPQKNPGIYPNKILTDIYFERSELPGVIGIRLSSMPIDPTKDNQKNILLHLRDIDNFKDISTKLLLDSYKHTYIIGPSIEVPNPFKFSVYIDNLSTEISTWSAKKVASPFMVEQLNRSLYSVKTLAGGKDKERAVAEVDSLLKTVLATQTAPALAANNLLQDGWENQPVAFIESQRGAVMGAALKENNGLHRIAARALVINLQFLSKQIAGK